MLKLISINIEMDMHHDTVIPFLQKEKADVVCMQELFESDISMYEESLGMKCIFEPMAHTASYKFGGDNDKFFGLAIFSNYEGLGECKYIVGRKDSVPLLINKNSITERNDCNVVLLSKDVKDGSGNIYKIATTHFTWTPPPGASTEYQREDARKLIKILDEDLKEFILIGDFNAPRGRETFAMFADKYKDNIPLTYNSSLDARFHRSPEIRSGERKNMVDCLFSTPNYSVKNVELIEGVSDHKAIVAYIEKVS